MELFTDQRILNILKMSKELFFEISGFFLRFEIFSDLTVFWYSIFKSENIVKIVNIIKSVKIGKNI